MKILSDKEYSKLISERKNLEKAFKNINFDFKTLKGDLNILESIKFEYSIVERFFSEISKLYHESPNFKEFSDNLSQFICKLIDAGAVIIGYSKNGILSDLGSSFKKDLEEDKKHFENFSEVEYKNSFIAQFFSTEEYRSFYWTKKDKINNEFISNKYPNVRLSRVAHNRIISYISSSKNLANLLIVPIKYHKSKYNGEQLFGYIMVYNINEDKLHAFKSILKIIAMHISKLFDINLVYKQSYSDYQFTSSLYSNFFEGGIQNIFKHISSIIKSNYSSFWIPTIKEKEKCFILKSNYSSSIESPKLKELRKDSIYSINETILSKVWDFDSFNSNYLDNYILLDTSNSQEIGFRRSSEIDFSSILIFPIYKYYNENRDIEKPFVIGVFVFYLKNNQTISKNNLKRISRIFREISFFIEHNLYDIRYHQINSLIFEFIKLETVKIENQFLEICESLKKIIHAEHVSIFLANKKEELFLRASTSLQFRSINKETREIIKEINVEKYLNNPDSPVYNDNSSITYRCYKEGVPMVCHDIHDKKIISNTSFCEATVIHHKSLLVIPIKTENSIIGVIRVINKKVLQDSILYTFTDNDVYIGSLSSKILANNIITSSYLLKQKLFIDSLAHENRTPIQIIELAIFNIQDILEEGHLDPHLKEELESNFTDVISFTSLISNNFKNLNAIVNSSNLDNSYAYSCVSLREKIKEVVGLIKPLVNQREGKNVSFSLKIRDMPNFNIDADRFIQVIYNLLSNAIRYSNNNSVVEVFYKKNVHEDFNGVLTNCGELKFENYGIGIESSEEELLFTNYFRSDIAQEIVPEGTGIGLPVTKKIIEDHGCKIRITKYHEPTIFSIFFPNTLICKKHE